jgi:hypothetical protein
MSDLQLSLFPPVVLPEAPRGAPGTGSRPPSPPGLAGIGPGTGDPETSDPGADLEPAGSLLDLLPRRIPGAGVEIVADVLGTAVHCRLRRSDRARRVRLVVDRSAVLSVVIPRRFPLAEVPDALREHARWIARTVERTRSRARPPRSHVEDGREVALFGVRHALRLLPADGLAERARVWRSGAEILVRVPPLHGRGPAELVRGWLRTHATREIPPRVRELNGPLGFPLRRITVRDQRTKWGACSAGGHVTLNWRLALAPTEVLDYVILHELCHLKELNHSARFWRILGSLRPDYERQRAWLKQNGDDLDV